MMFLKKMKAKEIPSSIEWALDGNVPTEASTKAREWLNS